MLRDYQKKAHDAAINWIRRETQPGLIDMPTASGKSWVISAIAHTLHKMSGKSILCTAPNKELVEQNYEKYLLTGDKASMFSASAGQISLRYPVVFGSPMTIKNRLRRFDDKFCAVIIDECHEITPTIKKIVDHIKSHNEFCRVIGTTATPYRLGSGYIFERDYDNRIVQEAIEPYFKKRIIKVDPYELTALGFLSPYTFVETAEHYDTSGLELNRQGKWINEDKAYSGQCRKTSNIIAEIVEKSRYRKGVIIFAATVRHAKECMASLPPGISAIVTGETGRLERDQIIRDFKSQKIKYFVNVGVATRGFDAPHVDVIALLRLTESKALLQQMIGRGMRTDDNKENFLILDYALNVDRHCNNNDIFDVDIETKEKNTAPQIQVICPYCGNDNYFSQVVNDKGYLINKNGYFTDIEGNTIGTEYGPLPAHYGRRCSFHDEITDKRCDYRWTSKPCPECETDNDVTTRYCSKCDYEFVDPNKNLTFDKIKDHSDDEIIDVHNIVIKDVVTKKGMSAKRVEIVSMAGRIYYIWFMHEHKYLKYAYFEFLNAYKKGVGRVTLNKKNGFYRIKKYDLSEVVEGVR